MASTARPPEAALEAFATQSPGYGWARGRWMWNLLTSMRTAIILLILLAAAAVPGSVLPQRNVASDPFSVSLFIQEHPQLSPWLERLSLFDVYGSPWFAAIYLLLLVSMSGCVIPRCFKLWRAARTPPPPAPKRMERERAYTSWATVDDDALLDQAAKLLRRKRFRVVRTGNEVRAERGYIREVGNLAFHLSLLVLLIGIAGGRLFGFEARAAIVEGDTFANIVSEYDAFTPSVWTDVDGLEPLSFSLDEFDVEFASSGSRIGEPRGFDAQITYQAGDEPVKSMSVRPNQPLDVNGTKFFLTGHGYAPIVTVRDGENNVAFSGPSIFLPRDPNFASDGVIKAPDAQPNGIAFEGAFLPTGVTNGDTNSDIPVSAFPGLANPVLIMNAWTGDLGLNDGAPESVYAFDKTSLDPVLGTDGQPSRETLRVGQTMTLPGGDGSLTFDGVSRFANFQIAYDPGKGISLLAALMLLVGLTTSLGVRRRQVWVRLIPEGPSSRIEVAGRALSRRELVPREIEALSEALGAPPTSSATPPTTDSLNRRETRP